MPEAVVEKPVCAKCGSDVRDGTAYCSNCGASVVAEKADLEKTIAIEPLVPAVHGEPAVSEPEGEDSPAETKASRTKPARGRKRPRVTARKNLAYRWERSDDLGLTLLAAVLVTLVVAVIVLVMVFWK